MSVHSTYAGSRQRNEGAWSWFVWSPAAGSFSGRDIGSHYPMTVLLRCRDVRLDKTTFGIHLDPCDGCIRRYGRVRF